MTIEYAAKQRSTEIQYVYGFSTFEKRVLISGIPKAISKLEKKIVKIENNPKNEGQATYSFDIDEINTEIKCLKEIEKTFLEDIEKYNSNQTRKKDMV